MGIIMNRRCTDNENIWLKQIIIVNDGLVISIKDIVLSFSGGGGWRASRVWVGSATRQISKGDVPMLLWHGGQAREGFLARADSDLSVSFLRGPFQRLVSFVYRKANRTAHILGDYSPTKTPICKAGHEKQS